MVCTTNIMDKDKGFYPSLLAWGEGGDIFNKGEGVISQTVCKKKNPNG